MTKNELFSSAEIITSIKATYEIHDAAGLIPTKQTSGELVLTDHEVVFFKVKGFFKKEKTKAHAYSKESTIGYHYESWGTGKATLILITKSEDENIQNYTYRCSKGAYEKFIQSFKEHGFV